MYSNPVVTWKTGEMRFKILLRKTCTLLRGNPIYLKFHFIIPTERERTHSITNTVSYKLTAVEPNLPEIINCIFCFLIHLKLKGMWLNYSPMINPVLKHIKKTAE